MNEKLKSVGTAVLGIGASVALLLLPILLLKGGLWLSAKIYPVLNILFSIAMFVSIFSLLPTALFRRSRGIAGVGLFIASYIFGATLWVWAFLLTYMLWGWLALLIGLFIMGVGIVPVAMLATIFKGEWSMFGELVSLLVLTFGARMLGLYLKAKYEEQSARFKSAVQVEDNSTTLPQLVSED